MGSKIKSKNTSGNTKPAHCACCMKPRWKHLKKSNIYVSAVTAQTENAKVVEKRRQKTPGGVKDFIPTTGINIRYIVPRVILLGKHCPSKVWGNFAKLPLHICENMYKTKNDQSKYTQTWAGTLDLSDKSEINQTYNIQTQKLIHECKQITVIRDLH